VPIRFQIEVIELGSRTKDRAYDMSDAELSEILDGKNYVYEYYWSANTAAGRITHLEDLRCGWCGYRPAAGSIKPYKAISDHLGSWHAMESNPIQIMEAL
jgi:hypothetical protein